MPPDQQERTGPNVHRIHSGAIDDALVFEAIAHELNVRPTRIEPRETQAPRLVYEALFARRDPVIFKTEVDAEGDEALVLEAWTLERVRTLGVPAPRVLALDVTASRLPGRYLILEKMRGLSLTPVWRDRTEDEADLTPEQLHAVLQTVGEHLGRVHGVEVAGYGRLDDERYLRTGEVRGQHDAWADVTIAPARAALEYLQSNALISDDTGARIRDVLEAHDEALRVCPSPRLLHGDVGAKHIFVDPETAELTAIIDWGDREAGDPAMDLANFELWEDEARLKALLEGYGGVTDDLRERIALCAIADGLRLAHKRYEQGRREAAEPVIAWLLPRIERALRL